MIPVINCLDHSFNIVRPASLYTLFFTILNSFYRKLFRMTLHHLYNLNLWHCVFIFFAIGVLIFCSQNFCCIILHGGSNQIHFLVLLFCFNYCLFTKSQDEVQLSFSFLLGKHEFMMMLSLTMNWGWGNLSKQNCYLFDASAYIRTESYICQQSSFSWAMGIYS